MDKKSFPLNTGCSILSWFKTPIAFKIMLELYGIFEEVIDKKYKIGTYEKYKLINNFISKHFQFGLSWNNLSKKIERFC